MLVLDFEGVRFCAGPCENESKEPPSLVPWYHYFIPHDGGVCAERVVKAKDGGEVCLRNFRVCVPCQSTLHLGVESSSVLEEKHQRVMIFDKLAELSACERAGRGLWQHRPMQGL